MPRKKKNETEPEAPKRGRRRRIPSPARAEETADAATGEGREQSARGRRRRRPKAVSASPGALPALPVPGQEMASEAVETKPENVLDSTVEAGDRRAAPPAEQSATPEPAAWETALRAARPKTPPTDKPTRPGPQPVPQPRKAATKKQDLDEAEQALREKYDCDAFTIICGTLRPGGGEGWGSKRVVTIRCQCGNERTVATSDIFHVKGCLTCSKAAKAEARKARKK